ncbi:MAG: selenocysteine-specific translation elongation factor [Oscillospiraceae bacterium]|nr:selenocysteine-specific translation elongation factor [Oscillospiraceae bacterium]
MKHIIIGTAGHVDHGKTTLVKALTGIDTDRLVEEKRRGVTIEPGFAYLDFEDGTRAGIIDVPGHERFIRNMLAGSGGVHLSMLVIAADEGVMPQTREHLGILTQLGIKDGLIVITKTDKVENDWLELVVEDINELTRNTFLKDKPNIFVSATTGIGIDELKTALLDMINNQSKSIQEHVRYTSDNASTHVGDAPQCVPQAESNTSPFRLPVDRVFPVDGFGMVVTGTIIDGSVKLGDTVEIKPSGEKATVRNLQVHGENVENAYEGQRTAISLSGIKRGSIKRGDVLAAEGSINITNVIDVKLNVLPDSKRTIKNGTELHFYHGVRTMLAKVFLLDKIELNHDKSCYARLKLKEQLPCKRGDRFVVRFYSPLETVGGGIILDSLPQNKLSRNNTAIQSLKIRELGSNEDIIILEADRINKVFTLKEISKQTDVNINECEKIINNFITEDKIKKLPSGKYISEKSLDNIGQKCKKILIEYHKEFPLRAGMNIAELRQKILPSTIATDGGEVLEMLKNKGFISISNNNASTPEFSPNLNEIQKKIKEQVIAELTKTRYDTPLKEALASMFRRNEQKDFEQVFESLKNNAEIIMLSTLIFWLSENYENAITIVQNHFKENQTLTLAECRDMLGTSRKFALAFLEHLDGKRITKLVGDTRVLN